MSQDTSPLRGRRAGRQAANDFLEMARHLREVQDRDPDGFLDKAAALGLSRRKAFYLARIDRQFAELGVDDDTLRRVGWTKLYALAPHVTEKNHRELLDKAEQLTVHQLQAELRNDPERKATKPVLLYLTDDQRAVLEQAVEHYRDATPASGTLHREKALIAALENALRFKT